MLLKGSTKIIAKWDLIFLNGHSSICNPTLPGLVESSYLGCGSDRNRAMDYLRGHMVCDSDHDSMAFSSVWQRKG